MGFKLNNFGNKPLTHKSDAIKNLKEPKCIKDIRSLMGSINQFNKFIPNLATLLLLFRKFNATKKQTFTLVWTKEHQERFEKKEVTKAAIDHHFDVSIESRVKCDALHTGLEASIEQNHDGVCKTIAFASHFLNGAEMKHSANKLEQLELVW